jgi:hypothetical protein
MAARKKDACMLKVCVGVELCVMKREVEGVVDQVGRLKTCLVKIRGWRRARSK